MGQENTKEIKPHCNVAAQLASISVAETSGISGVPISTCPHAGTRHNNHAMPRLHAWKAMLIAPISSTSIALERDERCVFK